MRNECRAVEVTIRERYGRIEQPPPGHAHADEQDGLDGDNPHPGRAEVPPLGPPSGAPLEGAPPPPESPHHDSETGAEANPDNEHLFPLGAAYDTCSRCFDYS